MNTFCVRALGAAALFTATAGMIAPRTAHSQQTYRNTVNQRFRTVSNGPQAAILVDVKDPNDLDAVHRAVSAKVRAVRAARSRSFSRIARVLPGRRGQKANEALTYVDTVLLRQNGKLLVPGRGVVRRDVPAGNALTINIATTGQFGYNLNDSTQAAKYQNLQTALSVLYPELVNLIGQPFANGTVTILNEDDDAADIHAASSIRGATLLLVNGDPNNINIEIHLPNFNSDTGNFQDSFLGLAQTLAQAFHLPAVTYDAFEQGMARAVASIATQELKRAGVGFVQAIDPVPGFFYTPFYDLQNQPALGNSTFFPPTSLKQNVNSVATMIAPRLQMAGTVWTKCYIENAGFFKAFNNAYYDAYKADATAPNNVTALRAAAGRAAPTVEGLPFDQWFEQQYVLDTSVTPGPKIYAFAQATAADQDVGAGAGIGVYYYSTDKTGDETALNATLTPTYFDHAYSALPSLDNTHPTEAITNGAGTTVPLFTGIGDTGTGENQQRIAVDLLVSSSQASASHPGGNEYVRLYFPANEESVNNTTTLTDFSGVLVGAQAGAFVVTFNGGGGPLVSGTSGGGVGGTGFGAFNGSDPGGRIPTGFTKATINFTPSNGTAIVFQRNVFVRKDDTANSLLAVAPIFVLNTGLDVATTAKLKAHNFSPGPQMTALPFQPYQVYTSNLPLLFTRGMFSPDPNAPLIAQYRQDGDANTGKYLRYPSLPPYQPGLSFWTNFAETVVAPDFSTAGQPTDNKDLITVPLQFGWNMIGNPYSTDILFDPASTTNGGIFVQYQNGDPLPLAEAVSTGLVATGVFGYNAATGAYQDITQLVSGGLPQNTLQAWQGYWLRVQVTEGVSLSYFNPVPATNVGGGRGVGVSRVKRSRVSSALMNEVGGWRMPIVVRDTSGNASGATLGQSPRGSDNFVAGLDASSPPAPITGRAPLSVRFPHADWDGGKAATGASDFLSDIRKTGANAQWDMIVNTPQAGQPYVLTWNKTAQLPRGTRLTLIDMETNTQHAMNAGTSYTFTPTKGAASRKFQVKVEPRLVGRLFISNSHVEARLSRGVAAAAAISYEVSGASEATIQIMTATGRVIRSLQRSRAVTSGVNQAVWDYKDDQGRALSTGNYLISITAKTPEGETARALVPHVITR